MSPRRWNGNRRRADRKAERIRTIRMRVVNEKREEDRRLHPSSHSPRHLEAVNQPDDAA